MTITWDSLLEKALKEYVFAFIPYYESKNCDKNLKCISEEININGIIYYITEGKLKNKNKHLENFKEQNESKSNDYRDTDEEELVKHINKKISKLPIHQLLKQIKLSEMLWHFDAVLL